MNIYLITKTWMAGRCHTTKNLDAFRTLKAAKKYIDQMIELDKERSILSDVIDYNIEKIELLDETYYI